MSAPRRARCSARLMTEFAACLGATACCAHLVRLAGSSGGHIVAIVLAGTGLSKHLARGCPTLGAGLCIAAVPPDVVASTTAVGDHLAGIQAHAAHPAGDNDMLPRAVACRRRLGLAH